MKNTPNYGENDMKNYEKLWEKYRIGEEMYKNEEKSKKNENFENVTFRSYVLFWDHWDIAGEGLTVCIKGSITRGFWKTYWTKVIGIIN